MSAVSTGRSSVQYVRWITITIVPALVFKAEGAGSPSVVPQVRHWIQEVLRDFPQDIRDRVEIIGSEYTTNCVRHSTAADGGDIHLRVTVSREKVRLEVRDRGPRQTAPDVWKPEEAADFGRGLYIVDQLADDMGDEVSSEGRVAWAEVKR
ncbi:ATP-binding protein [Actinoallomurus sp. CA-150999]|uniref:ATP-binding protein n=1 Tax=Actinoallomurus sp. CA-150999 TaxID=3239887 RepID=UPI003D8E1D11